VILYLYHRLACNMLVRLLFAIIGAVYAEIITNDVVYPKAYTMDS
jgi:hypothetical protein